MHVMVGNIFSPHWLKCAGSHMQGDLGRFNSTRLDIGDHVSVKMKACCRCRDSAIASSEYCLIALAVLSVI
jgi:hypothetical protein